MEVEFFKCRILLARTGKLFYVGNMRKSLRHFPLSWPRCFALLFAVVGLLWPSLTWAGYSIKAPLADGFDQAVGKPEATGYYIFRGFWPNGHLGEDWNGNGGGDSDMGDPVYAIADGVVVFSDDYKRRWGNVVIVRHAYREKNGSTVFIDSLYGHLDKRQARMYQVVKRGQQIGTRLLLTAETEARARGCLGAWLETFSPMARDFYIRQGYGTFGEIGEYPPGHARYFLCKRFEEFR